MKLSPKVWRARLRAVALVALVHIGLGSAAFAQTGTATLIGEVADAQKNVVPGATVTVTQVSTSASQVSITDERGAYRFGNVQPGVYTLRVELAGFKTAITESVQLQVDSATRQNVVLEIGGISETVSVMSQAARLNTTDASLGNNMSREQIRSLPVEAQNVVHLLSLQPGAVFIPTANPATVDPRYGSVAGARADQQSVTLDGIDVNDPQLATAYTSAIRMTQEALQEFRVSTSNYNAEMGRSSGPQVSLITRSGTNQYGGSGYWTARRTATSSNEYFLKLSQLGSGKESQAPKLDKDIFGGSFGGPIRRNKLFFFGNLEALRENSEAPVTRGVPSNSMRDGVLLYRCAVAALCPGGTVRGLTGNHNVEAGFYGMTPAEIAAIDPLGIGPSLAAMEYFRKYPSPNDPGTDGRNLMDYRFAAPIENEFLNLISRVDYKAADNHSFFGRFGKQDDTINNATQFPGTAPRRQRLFNNLGGALGYDAVLSPTLTNSFRYGFTKIDENNAGVTDGNYVTFRFISPFDGKGDGATTFTDTRQTPTQNIVNDLSWFKGRHTMKAGTNIRYTRVPKNRFQSSYLSASVNPSWVAGVGRRNMPGSAFCTVPGCNLPAVASSFQGGYADTWLNILGVLSTATQRVNYNIDGTPQAPGSPVSREIASDEYEVYLQDAWQLRSNLTLTAGVRYGLYSPPYEVNGFQVAPTISMGQWFDERARNAANGIPSNASPLITFDLAGPKNNRKGFYAWDKNNFAPRVALAWTPTSRIVLRGGYSKVFDRVGVGLATNFDEGFAFGLSTQITSPFGAAYESNPGARFRGIDVMPPTMPAAPRGGFPQTPPIRAGIITSSIDDTLVTPSAHMGSATIGFDLGSNYTFEAGYVGRFGRDLLVRRDLAMPLNLVDPASKTDYFTAAQAIIRAAQGAGLTGNSPASAYANLPAVAYWENIFPAAARAGLTATQVIARAFMQNGPDWITALYDLDTACIPACSKFGPYAYFAEQYDSLGGISSIGRSNYNGLNLTLRRRYSSGVQFDINYTLSKSEDMGSQVERGSAFGNFSNGGNSGFLINSFDPELNYGVSDFDIRHQVNTNWLAELPVGRGKRFGSGVNSFINHLIGDWSVAGLMRWTSGFPFNVSNCRSCWATNWNLTGNAMLVDPNDLPETGTTRNKVDNRPSPFVDPVDALTKFRRQLPGEAGVRNLLRGDGYFTLDTSLSKAWKIGIADHRIRFRWDVFNATNTPKFDVGNLTNTPDRSGFGRYNGTLATCDAQAGRCMQFALRYEF
ncbi:MAG TPA: TonB-dependent receptor [Vicinamibacterales bacterium]|nr:TonB-dependent receptor [Vicinamibacterales bacterium]